MNWRRIVGRTFAASGFVAPVPMPIVVPILGPIIGSIVILAIWARLVVFAPVPDPAYVVRVALPTGDAVGLPAIEGAADASRPLVVIDPGHGGHDPGAVAPPGAALDGPALDGPVAREKDLTLAMARALRDRLVADGRVRVALTRNNDRFLALEERAGIARKLHADLFLSIHADAAENPDAGGATLYTLSDKGSDAVADALAARENHADVINGVNFAGQSGAVPSFLVDLSQHEMRERSVALAELIRREGEGALRFHENPVRQAAFVVLKSLDLPSVLMEAGYVSNAADRAAMRDPAWRATFARVVGNAIEIAAARQTTP